RRPDRFVQRHPLVPHLIVIVHKPPGTNSNQLVQRVSRSAVTTASPSSSENRRPRGFCEAPHDMECLCLRKTHNARSFEEPADCNGSSCRCPSCEPLLPDLLWYRHGMAKAVLPHWLCPCPSP